MSSTKPSRTSTNKNNIIQKDIKNLQYPYLKDDVFLTQTVEKISWSFTTTTFTNVSNCSYIMCNGRNIGFYVCSLEDMAPFLPKVIITPRKSMKGKI